MRQTTLHECQSYHLQRESKANFTNSYIAGELNVDAAAPISKGVHHKELLVPSKTVAQCTKTYASGLETRREVNSDDKTSNTTKEKQTTKQA